MRIRPHSRKHGATLLEVLVYVAVIITITVFTMRILGNAAVIRSRGQERSAMVAVAQEQLDEQRRIVEDQIIPGEQRFTVGAGAYTFDVTRTITLRNDQLWLIELEVTRTSAEGSPRVRLAALRKGASS